MLLNRKFTRSACLGNRFCFGQRERNKQIAWLDVLYLKILNQITNRPHSCVRNSVMESGKKGLCIFLFINDKSPWTHFNLHLTYIAAFHLLSHVVPFLPPPTLSLKHAGPPGLCWAATRSRPCGAESGDDCSDPEKQRGFKVGQQPVAGGEPQTEAAAPDHPPAVRLTRRPCASDARVDGKKALCSSGKRQPLQWNDFLKMFRSGSCLQLFSFTCKLSLPLKAAVCCLYPQRSASMTSSLVAFERTPPSAAYLAFKHEGLVSNYSLSLWFCILDALFLMKIFEFICTCLCTVQLK